MDLKLHWMYAASPKTTAYSPGLDLIRAVAILYLLIFGSETDAESQFEVLDLYSRGFPSTCSKRLHWH